MVLLLGTEAQRFIMTHWNIDDWIQPRLQERRATSGVRVRDSASRRVCVCAMCVCEIVRAYGVGRRAPARKGTAVRDGNQ